MTKICTNLTKFCSHFVEINVFISVYKRIFGAQLLHFVTEKYPFSALKTTKMLTEPISNATFQPIIIFLIELNARYTMNVFKEHFVCRNLTGCHPNHFLKNFLYRKK